MLTSNRLFPLFAACFLFLAGCSTSTHPSVPVPVADPTLGPDPAEATLAEAAHSVSTALVSLDQMQQATTPLPPTFSPPTPSSYGMSNLVTIDWNGPIEPLLTQIADATGYHVNILGKPPSLPILVIVIAKNKPIGDVLRDAGYQCGIKADIVIFPKTKIIELRYATA
jgi:defect in organelle trafficking protein DotD